MSWRMRARHRLPEPERPVDRAGDADIVALLGACRSARDRLIVLLMARAGLRRGELCGLRRSDVHLLNDSRPLGCEITRAHVHVVRRDDNPNGAWAKSRRQRVVPLDFLIVQAFDTYVFERMTVPGAAAGDFVVVNLFREPIGAPMRPDGIGELLAAASRRAGCRGRSRRTGCGTLSAATPPTQGVASTWSPTCSVTPRCPRRRCICTRTRVGCGRRWTWCPAPGEQAAGVTR